MLTNPTREVAPSIGPVPITLLVPCPLSFFAFFERMWFVSARQALIKLYLMGDCERAAFARRRRKFFLRMMLSKRKFTRENEIPCEYR